MSMTEITERNQKISYELYREIAAELSIPIDCSLNAEVRFELYQSKYIYLNNLYQQCFRTLNQTSNLARESFTHEDLTLLQQSIAVTADFLKLAVLDALQASLDKRSKNEWILDSPCSPRQA